MIKIFLCDSVVADPHIGTYCTVPVAFVFMKYGMDSGLESFSKFYKWLKKKIDFRSGFTSKYGTGLMSSNKLKVSSIKNYLKCSYKLELLRCELVYRLLFPICLLLSLVPQQLLELRYFILPYLLARIQIKPASPVRLLAESLLHAGINSFVFYLFLERPFTWEQEPGRLQRFMW
jgi:hypothetical protein